MEARLSHMTGIGVIEVSLSSRNNLLNLSNSATSLLIVLYSASIEDKEIATNFFGFPCDENISKENNKPTNNFLW